MKRALVVSLSLLLAAPVAAAEGVGVRRRDPTPQQQAAKHERAERMARLCEGHHALSAETLLSLTDDDVRALVAVARDSARPIFVRARATSLVGVRPSVSVERLWDELLAAPERELRVQAAWARGLARHGSDRLGWAEALLDARDEAMREAGAHLLFLVEEREAAEVAASVRLHDEPEGPVRAVLERKLKSRGREGGR